MSLALLKHTGATSMDTAEKERLSQKWKASPLWPSITEQEPSVSMVGHERKFTSLDHFCPEVTFDRFGYFATALGRYVDEVDADFAHEMLAKEGAPREDWRWSWAGLVAQHYSECPTYSMLLHGNGATTIAPPAQPQNPVDSFFDRLKRSPLMAFLLISGVIVVALGSFTDALGQIWQLLASVFGRFVG